MRRPILLLAFLVAGGGIAAAQQTPPPAADKKPKPSSSDVELPEIGPMTEPVLKKQTAEVAVETDKVNTDVESPHAGVLAEILVPEGERAEVGQILARFADDLAHVA